MDVSVDNPEPDENNIDPLRHTTNRIETVVNLELDKLAASMIEELAPQTMILMGRLVSLSACLARQNSVSHGSVSVASNDASPSPAPIPTVPELTWSFTAALSHQKHVTITPTDLKHVPHLNGEPDVDINSCLIQYHLVAGFKVKAAMPCDTSAEKHGDNIAFEFCSLIMDGPCLVLYQQHMSGRIDWQAPVVSTEASNEAGSFTPPSN